MTGRTLYSGPGASGRRAARSGEWWGARWLRPALASAESAPISGRGVELRKRHGIWHVTRDGAFAGDFLTPETAQNAMTAARQALARRDGPETAPCDDWQTSPNRTTARDVAQKGRRCLS
jgi:hypothetical protein